MRNWNENVKYQIVPGFLEFSFVSISTKQFSCPLNVTQTFKALQENKIVCGFSQTEQYTYIYIYFLFYLDSMLWSIGHQAILTQLRIRCM